MVIWRTNLRKLKTETKTLKEDWWEEVRKEAKDPIPIPAVIAYLSQLMALESIRWKRNPWRLVRILGFRPRSIGSRRRRYCKMTQNPKIWK